MSAARAGRRMPLFGSILERYITREYLRFFLLAMLGFTSIVLLMDSFEKIDTFIDYDATWRQITNYYLHSLPYKLVLVTPVGLLLATFLSVGMMARNHELTVMKATGLSLYRLLLPIYIVSLTVAGCSFLLSDYIMPGAQVRAREIYDSEIKGHTTRDLGSRVNVNYIGQDNRFYLIGRYDVPRQTMLRLSIQEFQGNRLVRRYDARKAVYFENAWVLEDGVERTFGPDGEETLESFTRKPLDLPEVPEDFAKPVARPEEMSFPQLQAYTKRLGQSGGRTESFRTDLHLRIAFPFANFIIVLIGSTLAVQLRRGGVALGFGISLSLAFFYWSLIRTGQVLGHTGTLPPVLAAWLGNLVFLALGLFLLIRTNK